MKKIIWIIIGILVILFFSIFTHNPKSQEVTLGVIAGATGPYASAGEGYLKGFNLALDEWNSSHALKFKAIIEDDSFDAVKGLAAYQKLSSIDTVDAYAILSSFTIDAVYDLVHKENKPIALGFEQSKSSENDNIFQVLPAAKPVQFGLGQKLKELGYTKPIAVVSNNTSVYQNFYAGFNDGFGGNVKKIEMGSDIGGIRSQALALIADKPDVIAFFGVPKDGALLVKEILKIIPSGKRPQFAFDNSFQSGISDYENILGKDISQIDGGIISMSKNDFTPDFIQKYKTKYGSEPPFASEMGYNAFTLLAITYNDDTTKWINTMKTAKFTGADGEVYFDDTGLRAPNISFGKLKDGKVTQ